MQNKKLATFEIGDMLPIALTLVIVGIGVVYGLNVLGDLSDDMADCSTGYGATDNLSYNASNNLCYNTSLVTAPNVVPVNTEFTASSNAVTGLAKLPEKLPIIVTVVVAAIIIGILVRYLAVRMR